MLGCVQGCLLFRLVLLIWTANTFFIVRGQQLTCSGEFTVARYSRGERFLTAVDGKNYDCSCQGIDCQQITCIVLQSTEQNSTEPIQICRDPETGRSYARGTTFVRYGRNGVNLACTCAADGPLKIDCKPPTCKIPPPPPPTKAHLQNSAGSCYDQHNDDWFPYEVPYIRRVVMSYSPDIIGEYNCICNRYSTRCTAVNVPCCDTRTGTFVAKNQRFVTEVDGLLPMNCVCLGGRGKIGKCERLNDRREIGSSQIVRKHRCFDSTTNRYYVEGASFAQLRRSGERRCSCKRKRGRLSIICKRSNRRQ